MPGKEARAGKFSLFILSFYIFSHHPLLLAQYTWSVRQVARLQVKNFVLSSDALRSEVRILIHETLLLHAEQFNHLTHFLHRRRSDNPLGYLIVCCLLVHWLRSLHLLVMLLERGQRIGEFDC